MMHPGLLLSYNARVARQLCEGLDHHALLPVDRQMQVPVV